MAYQNVGTPRFYIDLFQYFRAIGYIEKTRRFIYYPDGDAPETDIGDNDYAIYNSDLQGTSYNPFGLNPSRLNYFPSQVDTAGWSMCEYHFATDPLQWDADGVEYYDPALRQRRLASWQMHRHINYCAVLSHNLIGSQPNADFALMPQMMSRHVPVSGQFTIPQSSWPKFKASGYKDVIGTELAIHDSMPDALQFKMNNYNGFGICLMDDGIEAPPSNAHSDYHGGYPHCLQLLIASRNNVNNQEFERHNPFELTLGAVSMGNYYDMPHAPNMKLTFKRDYDGIDTLKTRGGSTLTNIRYTGSPNWAHEEPAWSRFPTIVPPSHTLGALKPENNKMTRNGRRSWRLSFDMLSDDNIMGAYESLNVFPYKTDYLPMDHLPMPSNSEGDISGFDIPLLEEDNFYSQVLVKTLGGQLPFIFQPDNTNNSPDQFAICKIKKGSFSFSAKGHKLYNVKMEIVESW